MFGTFRKHSQPLWIVIIIVIVISFVVFFTPDFDPFDTGGTITADAAAVEQARSEILLNEVIELRQRQSLVKRLTQAGRIQEALQVVGGNEQEAFQQVMQLMRSPDVLATTSASRIAGNSRHIDLNGDNYNDINSLEYRARIRLRQLTLAKNKKQLGIRISDSAVNAARNSMVQNLTGAQEYNADQYDQLLKQLNKGGFIKKGRIGQEQFEDYLRNRLMLLQLNAMMTRSAGFWPDTDMAETLAQQNREYAVEAAFVSLTNHTASATNYANITKAEGFTNHFNQVAVQYQVPVRRTIAYVKLALADFEGDIRKELKFDDQVQKLIELHNTTTNRITETNGTALPINATNLLARAEEEVRKTPFGEQILGAQNKTLGDRIFLDSDAAARAQAKAFRKALFPPGGRPYATTNLWATARQFNLEVQTATFSRKAPPEDLPTVLIDAAFSSSLKAGKLLESAVYSPESIYILGLQEIIPLKIRQYAELTKDEQKKVDEEFLKSETRRLAREAGEKFQATATANLKEGRPFIHSATNAGLSVVTLPPFSLNAEADTNLVDLLKGFVPPTTLQGALYSFEQGQQSKVGPEKENLTDYLEYAGDDSNTIAGYVLHVTGRINPVTPDDTELRAFAERARQYARNQAAGSDWFVSYRRQLDSEIIISSLESRLEGLPSEIREVKENILYKEQTLARQFANSLKQAGITDGEIISPLEKWAEAQTGTLKKFASINYFATPPKQPEAAQIIVPLLSAKLRQPWEDLTEVTEELEKLEKLKDGGIKKAIDEKIKSSKQK
ncbi:hypothetical protein OAK45_04460 [Verrucomicrobia bacterium]|nr:hypothetical protein [Verrucomicrobiota bacterium]MDC0219150.1 hypothetical protein [Verrucomicrobiota bacterium]